MIYGLTWTWAMPGSCRITHMYQNFESPKCSVKPMLVYKAGTLMVHVRYFDIQWIYPNGRRFTQDRMRLNLLLREGFRADCFQKWSMSTRNDAEACQGIVYNESRCQMTRQLEQQSQHRFAILTGGFASAAAFDVMKGTSSRCSCGACNSLDHMVWWCQHVPLPSQRPPVPTDWLQRRLGWPSGSPYDEATISWMVHRGLLPTDISHLHNSEVIAQLICQIFLENYFQILHWCNRVLQFQWNSRSTLIHCQSQAADIGAWTMCRW